MGSVAGDSGACSARSTAGATSGGSGAAAEATCSTDTVTGSTGSGSSTTLVGAAAAAACAGTDAPGDGAALDSISKPAPKSDDVEAAGEKAKAPPGAGGTRTVGKWMGASA